MLQRTAISIFISLLIQLPFFGHSQKTGILHFGFGKFIIPNGSHPYQPVQGAYHAETGAFLPLPWRSNKTGTQVGMEFKIGYTRWSVKNQPPPRISGLKYSNGGSAPVDISLDLRRDGRNKGIQFMSGPAFVFSNKKFFFSPSLLMGLGLFSRQGIHYYDTIYQAGSQMQTIDFYVEPLQRTAWIVIDPSVKAGFKVSSSLLLSVSAHYIWGPMLGFSSHMYIPRGNPSSSGVYTYEQMSEGGFMVADGGKRWEGGAIQFNVSYQLPSKK